MKQRLISIMTLAAVCLTLGGCTLNYGEQYNGGSFFPYGTVYVLGTKASSQMKFVHLNWCEGDRQCTHNFIQNQYDVPDPYLHYILLEGASPPGDNNFYSALASLQPDECLRWQHLGIYSLTFLAVKLGEDPACAVLETSLVPAEE
jgi:hypothetical protein